MQPQIRGGKKKKLKRNESLRAALLARVARWNQGDHAGLWGEANAAYADVKAALLAIQARQAISSGPGRALRMLGTGKLFLRCCPLAQLR
jgi:hypothetical protein